MKKICIILLGLLLIFSCKTVTTLPPAENITIIEKVDSIVYRDSIVYIPVEVTKDIVPHYDTLHLETSLAESDAWVDTTMNVLRGQIKNKEGKTFYQKEKTKIEYRDSIVYKEKPIPYPVKEIEYRSTFFDKLCWLISSVFLFYIIIRYIRRKYGR